MNDDYEDLRTRNETSENRQGRLRFTFALTLLLALSVAAHLEGAPAQPRLPRVIEAERFILRDSSGRARIVLEMSTVDPSQPEISIRDETGKRRATIHSNRDVSGINLYDAGGQQKIVLGWSYGVGSTLQINGKRGTLNLTSYEDAGASGLSISTAGSGPRVFIGIEEGRPKMTLSGPDRILFQAP